MTSALENGYVLKTYRLKYYIQPCRLHGDIFCQDLKVPKKVNLPLCKPRKYVRMWSLSSTKFSTRHSMEMSGRHHISDIIPSVKKPREPVKYKDI
jgi:hypothetical protein